MSKARFYGVMLFFVGMMFGAFAVRIKVERERLAQHPWCESGCMVP